MKDMTERKVAARPALVAVALALAWLSEIPGAVGACRHVIVEAPGVGPIRGAEDIAVDRGRGLLYLSAYNRRAVAARKINAAGRIEQGGIYALPLTALATGGHITARDVSAPFKRRHDFRPHGIALYRKNGIVRALFAINHAYRRVDRDWVRSDRVEMFDIDSRGLKHRGPAGTVLHPLMCGANDIVALGLANFLITNDHGACGGLPRFAEDVLGLSSSYVLHYDGRTLRKVAQNIPFANGIAVGPGGLVYVAATRGRGIRVYGLQALLAARTPLAASRSVIPVGSGTDNLTLDSDGVLLVAQHPSLFDLAIHMRGWFGPRDAESRVLSIVPSGRARPQVREVFRDSGRTFSAATVAVSVRGYTVIGSVTAPGIMVCSKAANARDMR